MRSFSHVNFQIEKILRKEFPDYHVEVIDLWEDLMNPHNIFNLLCAFKEYGLKILWGNLTYSYLRTSNLYRKLKSLVMQKIDPEKYLFTFQTQSLFDLSIPGVPHFIYTDNSQLANRKYLGSHNKNIYVCFMKELIHSLKMQKSPYYSFKIDVSKHILEKIVTDPCKIAMEKAIYQNATLNFTMSDNVTQSIIHDYDTNPQKVVCVNAGSNVDVTSGHPFNREKYKYKNILFVGMNWERKGGPELIKAFLKVLEVHPDARLTIVGCKPKINIPNCTVVPRVPLEEVNKFYENASVFCLPTKWEPFGIVFIEALMNRLPVVATKIAAISDFVTEGKNGYLVEPSNPGQLAKALIQMIGDPEKCADFGEWSYQVAVEKYSWKKTGEKIKQHIEKAIR